MPLGNPGFAAAAVMGQRLKIAMVHSLGDQAITVS